MSKIRFNCYFFDLCNDENNEDVPTCTYFQKIGHCPCSPDCIAFIGHKQIHDIAMEIVRNKIKEKDK